MMSKMIVSSMVVVCLAVLVNSAQLKVNRRLENGYRKAYGAGKPVVWQEISKMSQEQLAQICKDVHVLTNYGPLQDEDLKEVKVQDAYLEFSNPKLKRTSTQVLSCKKNNKEQYVYYLAKGLEKDSAMLVYVSKTTKPIDGKNVFTFTGHNQISHIPALQ